MLDAETLKALIRQAFSEARYPGDRRLRGSDEGEEPFAVERDFRGKRDWRALDSTFLDRSPDGLASALSMFSHEAFRFYLPGYLIADVDGKLECSNPAFHLTHGVDAASRTKLINPRRYGNRTWFDYAKERFSFFSDQESAAIAAYLSFRRDADASAREEIDQALEYYWNVRTASRQ